MKIRWIGHAAFHIETAGGTKIRTDPYDKSIGLATSDLPADVVTVSHDHFDHNAAKTVPGKPQVLKGNVNMTFADAGIRSVATYHDEEKGSTRGDNMIFIIEADGVRLAHMGDLGHVLSEAQLAAVGAIDVALVPVGGIYTLDAAGATELLAQFKPRITVPMHFKTPDLQVAVGPVDDFLEGKANVRQAAQLSVGPDDIPEEPQIVVLEPRP